jgi:putative endopeptidase
MPNLRRSIVRTLPVLAIAVSGLSLAQAQQAPPDRQGPPSELPTLARFSAAVADRTLDPCDDFYAYSCSRWLTAHPPPADQAAWGTTSSLALWNQTLLAGALQELAAGGGVRNADGKKVGDFYHSCMDEPTIEAHGKEWLQPELDRIAAIKKTSDIAAEVAHLHQMIPGAWAPGDNQTNSPLMGFGGQPDLEDARSNIAQFDQGGMSLPGRSYYLDQDAKSTSIREKYVKHIGRMLVLAGREPERATAEASVVLAMETELARAQTDAITRRDPKSQNNKMTLTQLKALAPSFDFEAYLRLAQAPPSSVYNVTAPNFFKAVEALLRERPLEDWRAYLRSQLVQGTAPTMGRAFVDEAFDFFGRTLAGAKEIQPRWRRCVNSVDANLGDALGEVYVAEAFPSQNKERVLALVHDLDTALSKDIDSLGWMSAQTKKEAHAKLSATLEKIGYPEHGRDLSRLEIRRDSFFHNRNHAAAFEFTRWVGKIGRPVDRNEWTMTPATVNAYEDSSTNTINFPAGILQPPLFEMSQDDSVNYGAIGSVIGHEIIHGFDDQGRKFDAQGNLRDWWSTEDAQEYESRDKCISDQYSQEIPEAGLKQDGRMTLGEDTADNGGLRLSHMALENSLGRQGRGLDTKESDGLTPRQRFFMAFAFGWCSQYQPELLRLVVLTDPHSYPKSRVNNTVANMPEFRAAFGCHEGQPEARVNACRVW